MGLCGQNAGSGDRLKSTLSPGSRTVVGLIYYSLSQLWATYNTSLSVLQDLGMRFKDPFQKLKTMCDAQ